MTWRQQMRVAIVRLGAGHDVTREWIYRPKISIMNIVSVRPPNVFIILHWLFRFRLHSSSSVTEKRAERGSPYKSGKPFSPAFLQKAAERPRSIEYGKQVCIRSRSKRLAIDFSCRTTYLTLLSYVHLPYVEEQRSVRSNAPKQRRRPIAHS